MGVVPGWADGDVFVLLELFRAHLWDYIYRSGEDFAKIVHAALPAKSEEDVVEAVRLVMKQFALAFDTHNFRGQRLIVDGSEVFVYEYLHETIKLLRENRSGGVYLPDELVRFLRKAKMYKQQNFYSSPKVFFSRIQLWGKSIAESRAKFYALRDMYHIEKQAGTQYDSRDAVNAIRFQELAELFDDVPRAPPKSQEPVSTPKVSSKLWSPEDLEVLVDLLVAITRDVQQKGTSPLVETTASRLRRTQGSCVNKLQDIRERFLKNTTAFRAANLPDVIYDPASDANKIFNADWTDPHDPYAVGYLAMKAYFNRTAKRKKTAPVPSFRTTRAMVRQTLSPSNPHHSSNHTGHGPNPLRQSAPRHKLGVAEEIASIYGWTYNRASEVLASMKRNLQLYRAKQRLAFFVAISGSMGGAGMDDVFVTGSQILRLFETRFGGLEVLETLPLGREEDTAIGTAGVRKENDASLLTGTAGGLFSGGKNVNPLALSRMPGNDSLHNSVSSNSQQGASSASSASDASSSFPKRLGAVDSYLAHGYAQGSEIDWDEDSPERFSPGDEDVSEDQSFDSPEHTCLFLDSPAHASSTSSCTSESKESRSSGASSRKRFRMPSHRSSGFCISCQKKIKGSSSSGNSAAPNASFGKQMSSMSTPASLARYYKDDDEDDEAEGGDESNNDLDSDADTSDDESNLHGDLAAAELTSKLQALIQAEDARIKELEARNHELIERKAERERLAAEAEAAERVRNEAEARVSASLRV